jgi:hypothetical protein
MAKIRVRGYGGDALIFQETIAFEEGDDLERIAAEHMTLLLPHPMHMLEFEFMDELDPNQRYFRWGTDKRRMVQPVAFDLTKLPRRSDA